jgi:hypothetical protein
VTDATRAVRRLFGDRLLEVARLKTEEQPKAHPRMKKRSGVRLSDIAARLVVVRGSVYRVLSTSADGGGDRQVVV